jgi:hypothetical protein
MKNMLMFIRNCETKSIGTSLDSFLKIVYRIEGPP